MTSFSGSSLLFFVAFVDFARRNELLSDPFLALYDLKLGKSGGSVVFLVDSIVVLEYILLCCPCGPQYF